MYARAGCIRRFIRCLLLCKMHHYALGLGTGAPAQDAMYQTHIISSIFYTAHSQRLSTYARPHALLSLRSELEKLPINIKGREEYHQLLQ